MLEVDVSVLSRKISMAGEDNLEPPTSLQSLNRRASRSKRRRVYFVTHTDRVRPLTRVSQHEIRIRFSPYKFPSPISSLTVYCAMRKKKIQFPKSTVQNVNPFFSVQRVRNCSFVGDSSLDGHKFTNCKKK